MTRHSVTWCSHDRKARCAPDPDFPDGKDIDVAGKAASACQVALPYPAACCGVWLITYTECGLNVGVTAAGRPDDPKTVRIACKERDHVD
jgi:hypothetical protein